MQSDPVVSKASELLRLGLMPTPEEVEGGKVTTNPLALVTKRHLIDNCRHQDLLSVDIASTSALAQLKG